MRSDLQPFDPSTLHPLPSSRGFTVAEILVSIAIIMLLVAMGLYAFMSARKTANVMTTADTIAAELESAKESAIQGKGGSAFGVKFNATSTVTFTGASYGAGAGTYATTTFPSDISLTYTMGGPDYALVFARLTGTTTAATITVNGQATSTIISVGSLGDISVIK